MGKLVSILTAMTLIIFATSTVYGLRCGNKLVKLDQSKLYVLKACGQPDIIDASAHSSFGSEIWMYDRGSNKFMVSIQFRNGRVVHIKDDTYGVN